MIPTLLLGLAGCLTTTALEPDGWPEGGCSSEHRPQRGAALATFERHRLVAEDGIELAAGVLRPVGEGCWPGVVYVPPGFEPGLPEWDDPASAVIVGAGAVIAFYDPRGRGDSGGEEDYGGPRHQDDLAGVIHWLASREDVDPTRVLVRTRSYGVVHAVGALSRHPALQPYGLLDIEGPGVLPDDLEKASEFARDTLYEAAEGDQWWAERSPAPMLETFGGHYRRVQAAEDHQLGSYMGAARVMLEVASRYAPEPVDLNGLTPADSQLYESTEETIWPYDMVQELALDGRVKHDDERALDLLLDMLQPR